eukprot:UN4156
MQWAPPNARAVTSSRVPQHSVECVQRSPRAEAAKMEAITGTCTTHMRIQCAVQVSTGCACCMRMRE